MKDRLLNIQLTNEVQPKIKEINGSDWVQFGDGEYRNLYPQYLIDLYNNSATHAAVVNATAAMIAGEDILVEEGKDLQQYVEVKKLLASINGTETAHEVLVKVAFDLKLQGSFAINIIWSKDRTRIAEIHHVPVEQVRVGKPDAHNKVKDYYISADWSQYRKKEYSPKRIATFNTNDRREASQLLYTGVYSPAMELYFTPDYIASTNWVQVDNLTSDYHLNNIANGFAASYFINFTNGIPTQEEREQIEFQIARKFSGSHNSGKFVLTFSDDANSKPEIVPIQVSNADKQYTVLNELCIQNIMIGHRVTSPMLLGVKTEGQLGGRDELVQAYELYMNTVIKPFQNIILKAFKKLLAVNNIVTPIIIKDVQPLNAIFDADTLKEVLTQDELRQEMGYEALDNNEQTVAQEQKLEKVNLLEDFIGKYGEDEDLQSWQLIDEEELVDDEQEHEEFDFEHNLNELAKKLNLTRTGEARNRGSKQDGKDKENNRYRVRYQYAPKSKSHSAQREFCRKMISANKIYRKEDIIGQAHSLSSIPANPKLAPKGSSSGIYNIWLYKGGVNCYHKWTRKIYVTKEGNTPNYATDEVINKTKARSRGFRPEENDQRIYQAPIDMPKKGRLN